MRSQRSSFLVAAAAVAPLTLAAFLLPAAASAQAEADEALEEITVTARRREESLQDVPVAITAISGDELVNIGASDLTEIQAYSPNLVIYPGRNQSTTLTAFVRGIGQADPLWGVDPGVGLYLDDVYVARPQGALLDVFDVERVEVLRGPQGTLYGKNTIGGAIKYVSRPLTDEATGGLSWTVGEYQTSEVRGSIGGALIDGVLRARVAGAVIANDGYGTNVFTGEEVNNKETTAYRVALEWLPTEDLSVKLTYDKTDDTSKPKGYKRLEANPFCGLFLISCDPLDNPFDVEAGLEPTNGTESNGGSLTATWNVNDTWTAKLISAYRESDSKNNIDFDTTPAQITDVFATYYDEQYTHELQFLYDGGERLAGVAGIYYLDGTAGGLVQNIFFGSIFGTTNGVTETDSIAAYTDWSYALTDRLRLNAGVRFIAEEKRGIALNQGFSDATFETVTATTADYDQTEDFDSTAPKIGLDYSLTEDVMVYGHVSQGFKSGGFNVRAQSTAFPESAAPFDDEELTNYEFGMKGSFLDSQLTLNTALFWGDYKDIQVSTFTDFDSDNDGINDSFFGAFLNAGEATLSGVEIEWSYTPLDIEWLRLSGNLNYLDTDADIVDLNDNGLPDVQVITNAPQKTAALFADIIAPMGDGTLTARFGFSYRDATLMTNEGEGTVPLEQGAYQLWNASVAYTTSDEHWTFALHAKNMRDKEYLTNGYNIPVLGIKTGSLGTPRTVLASVGYSF